MDELKIPKLNGDNYTAWSIRTRAALVQKNSWEAIDPGYGAELTDEERKENERALTFLFLVVEDEFLDDIADCSRAKDAWFSLKDVHTKFGLLHTLQLLKEFFNVSMNIGESMNSYLGRLMNLHRKVDACGYGFTDREIALVMLMGLPKEYEGLILNLERDEKDLSSKVVKSKLLVEEKKLSRNVSGIRREFIGEKALEVRNNEKYPVHELSQKNERTDKSNERSIRANKSNERSIRCYNCGLWGHISRFCEFSRNLRRADTIIDDTHQALAADSGSKNSSSDWYLDSGATEHMCAQKERFFDLVSSKSKVEVANSEKIEVAGIGNVVLKPMTDYGSKSIYLANVLYVPELDSNLLSVGRIEEMGMIINFEKGKAIIKDPRQKNKVILIAYRSGRLYKIKEESNQKIYFTRYENLMHKRLGHFHHNAIKKMIPKDLISNGGDEEDLEKNEI